MHGSNHVSQWFKVVLFSLSILQVGCSIDPVRTVVVKGESLQKRPGVPVISMNNKQDSMEDIVNGYWNYGGRILESARGGDPTRVKFHTSYSQNRWMVVEGTLGSGKKYPVVIDTGASPALFVNDIHILENKLAIRPLGVSGNNSSGWGICHLPELRIGKVTLANWPCFYREQHTEVQLFGLSVSRDKPIIVGLPALKRFKYIAFDSINKEVEFSLEKPFECDRHDLWTRYSFVIEEYLGGNAFLFVKIPIAGEETELQLDTGCGRGLAINEELWEKIRRRIQNTTLIKGKDLYPYIGWLACKRGIIPKLDVGARTLMNANISVFPNDSPLVDQCQGLLGMQCFRNTVMVLDFERNSMWVKYPQKP